MMLYDEEYWNARFIGNDTPWDIGQPSTPLKEYIDQLTDKSIRILIPGAGNGYEAEYAYEKGFTNTFVLDIATEAIERFKKRCPHFPVVNIIYQDFFIHTAQYDLILEQTFFCALGKALRKDYVAKMKELLALNGKLVGVLFNREFPFNHPPFGGNKEEYLELFQKKFTSVKIEECYNSIKPRANSELFLQVK